MRDIAITEVKAKLLQIVKDVERGETIRITHRGRPVARLVPDAEAALARRKEAVEAIREIGRRTKGMTVEEILSARDEGRRY